MPASRSRVIPDAARTSLDGNAMLALHFGDGVLLDLGAAYWNDDEMLGNDDITVEITVESATTTGGTVYNFALIAYDEPAVEAADLNDVVYLTQLPGISAPGSYQMSVSRGTYETLVGDDFNPAYLSVVCHTTARRVQTITFSNTATDDDAVSIDVTDGDTPIEYVFGDGTGGTVNKGASAAASATNLIAAIQADIDAGDYWAANTLPNNANVTVATGGSGVVSISMPIVYGSEVVAEEVDGSARITVSAVTEGAYAITAHAHIA